MKASERGWISHDFPNNGQSNAGHVGQTHVELRKQKGTVNGRDIIITWDS